MREIKQTCATCRHFEFSRLENYGYCKAAPGFEAQARLLVAGGVCVFGRWGR